METKTADSKSDRAAVLLSEGSSSSARQTLYCLGNRYRVGIADPSRMCLARFSSLVHRYHRCPSFATRPVEYLEYLVKTIDSNRYDVLFPTHEQVYLLARFRDVLKTRVGLALPHFDALRAMQGKADFTRLLMELGLEVPPTRFVDSLDAMDASWQYPCWVKLPHSTAGNGVRLVRSYDEVRRVAEEFGRTGRLRDVKEFVVQQPATGIQAVVQAVFQHGRLVAAHCAEAHSVGVGGGQMHRDSACHLGVVEDVRRLGAHLEWHGAMFLEYFYDPTSRRAQYIEANPRIGETVNAMLAGVNLCDLLVRISLGEEVPALSPSTVAVRSHVGFLWLVAKAMKGASRRELLREMWQSMRGQGRYEGAHNEMMRPGEDPLSMVPAGAVALQLLLRPHSAHTIVRNTVDNYSLSETGARLVETLSDDHVQLSPVPTSGRRR